MIGQPGTSVANWKGLSDLWFEKRKLDEDADEISDRLDGTDLDHSWENVSRLIVPLAIKMKMLIMILDLGYNGTMISNCDDNIHADSLSRSPYINFWYFGKVKKRVKVKI